MSGIPSGQKDDVIGIKKLTLQATPYGASNESKLSRGSRASKLSLGKTNRS